MKEYGHLLRDDPAWAGRAAAFSAKCKDISEILCELEPRAQRHPLKLRVAYHDACHLQHAQGVHEQPRRLLGGIPELQVVEIPEGSLCCGSAGIFNLLQPETASQLGSRQPAFNRCTGSALRESRLPAAAHECSSSARVEGNARVSHGGVARCFYPWRLH